MGGCKGERRNKICCWDFFSVICLPSTYTPTDNSTTTYTTPLALWEHLPTAHTHQEAVKVNLDITTTHSQITTAISSTLPYFPLSTCNTLRYFLSHHVCIKCTCRQQSSTEGSTHSRNCWGCASGNSRPPFPCNLQVKVISA